MVPDLMSVVLYPRNSRRCLDAAILKGDIRRLSNQTVPLCQCQFSWGLPFLLGFSTKPASRRSYMLRTTLIAATAAIGLTGAAIADGAKAPAILDDEALDGVVAGATVSPLQGSNSDIDQAVGPRAGPPVDDAELEARQRRNDDRDGGLARAARVHTGAA